MEIRLVFKSEVFDFLPIHSAFFLEELLIEFESSADVLCSGFAMLEPDLVGSAGAENFKHVGNIYEWSSI